MSDELIIIESGEVSTDLRHTAEKAKDYIKNSKAANTRRTYASDWKDFTSWCNEKGFQSLPAAPQTVVLYLSHLAEVGRKVSTIQHHLTAISQAHDTVEAENPLHSSLVQNTMKGIRRTLGTAPAQKKAAVVNDIRLMVESLPNNLMGLRDKALLLVGFLGAFRRSELVSLNVDDLDFQPEGVVITLRRSKTDQEGEGRRIAIPVGEHHQTCPISALQMWLTVAGIEEGPIFRGMNRHGQVMSDRMTDQVVAKVVKRAAEASGLDPKKFAGHSLRAGLATSAAMAGALERDIMKQTGHKSVQMVRRYIREGELFKNNVAASLGL